MRQSVRHPLLRILPESERLSGSYRSAKLAMWLQLNGCYQSSHHHYAGLALLILFRPQPLPVGWPAAIRRIFNCGPSVPRSQLLLFPLQTGNEIMDHHGVSGRRFGSRFDESRQFRWDADCHHSSRSPQRARVPSFGTQTPPRHQR